MSQVTFQNIFISSCVKAYCTDSDLPLTSRFKLSIALLNVLNQRENAPSHFGFEDFIAQISNIKISEYDQDSDSLFSYIFNQTCRLENVHDFTSFIDELQWLFYDSEKAQEESFNQTVLKKDSILGVYIREICVAAALMDFSASCAAFDKIKISVDQFIKHSKIEYIISPSFDHLDFQFELLQDECVVLYPEKIRQSLETMYIKLPHSSKTLYFEYLYNAYQGNYVEAKDSLIKFFDSNFHQDGSAVLGKLKAPDIFGTRSSYQPQTHFIGYHYALLNLSLLQTRFGFTELAQKSLEEASAAAQDQQDYACLLLIQAWKNKLALNFTRNISMRSILDENQLGKYTIDELEGLEQKYEKVEALANENMHLKLSSSLEKAHFHLETGNGTSTIIENISQLKFHIFYNEIEPLYGRLHSLYSEAWEKTEGNILLKWLHASIGVGFYGTSSALDCQTMLLSSFANSLAQIGFVKPSIKLLSNVIEQSKQKARLFEAQKHFISEAATRTLSCICEKYDFVDNIRETGGKTAYVAYYKHLGLQTPIKDVLIQCASKYKNGLSFETCYKLSSIAESQAVEKLAPLKAECYSLLSLMSLAAEDPVAAAHQAKAAIHSSDSKQPIIAKYAQCCTIHFIQQVSNNEEYKSTIKKQIKNLLVEAIAGYNVMPILSVSKILN